MKLLKFKQIFLDRYYYINVNNRTLFNIYLMYIANFMIKLLFNKHCDKMFELNKRVRVYLGLLLQC